MAKCSNCGGDKQCTICDGSGQKQGGTLPGHTPYTHQCPTCKGSGRCFTCRGTGIEPPTR